MTWLLLVAGLLLVTVALLVHSWWLWLLVGLWLAFALGPSRCR